MEVENTEFASSTDNTGGQSADMLFSKDREVLDRADRVLARGNVRLLGSDGDAASSPPVPSSLVAAGGPGVETKIPTVATPAPASVRTALTQQQRRALVHNHLQYKWSMANSQAAIVKTGHRKVVIAKLNTEPLESSLTSSEPSKRYSGWCPICKSQKEWCGFKHERQQTSGSKTNDVGQHNFSEYEAKIQRKARRRRGNKIAEKWKQGEIRRTAASIWNQKRIGVLLREGEEEGSGDEYEQDVKVEEVEHVEEVEEVEKVEEVAEVAEVANVEAPKQDMNG